MIILAMLNEKWLKHASVKAAPRNREAGERTSVTYEIWFGYEVRCFAGTVIFLASRDGELKEG